MVAFTHGTCDYGVNIATDQSDTQTGKSTMTEQGQIVVKNRRDEVPDGVWLCI